MSSPDPDTSAFNEFAFQTILDQYQEEEIWKMYKEQQKLDEQLKEDEKKIEYLEDVREGDEEFSLMNYSDEFDIRPVADNPGLYKDMENGSVLNMDGPLGKKSLNIDGFGEKQIKQFYELKLIKKIDDIFSLHKYEKKIISLNGWGDLSFRNLINSDLLMIL